MNEEKEILMNQLLMTIEPYVDDPDAMSSIKMKFDMILHDFDFQKAERSLTVYEGDLNEQMIKRFAAAKIAKGLSKRTIEYYVNTLHLFFKATGKTYDQITPDDIRYFLAKKVTIEGVTKVTANNIRRNISSFYSWLQREDLIAKNPMLKVDKIKTTKLNKKAFTNYEIELIRDKCTNVRDRAIVEMLLSTWCRVSELSGMKKEDINGNKILVHGKGDKYRTVYINAKAKVALDKYLASRDDDNPYLFVSLNSPHEKLENSGIEIMIRELGKEAGVEHCHPHRFRRTGATLALRTGMPLIQVSKLLGHENVSTTQIYLDINQTELELAHDKYVF